MLKFHYVYRITNLVKNKHYYGIRSTKVKPIDDLGVKYFSSSTDKDFIKDQKNNPQDYRYKIIFVYDSRKTALRTEIKLHEMFNVGVNESFYNRSKQTAIGFDRSGVTYQHSVEAKIKIGNAHKGKIVSNKTKEKLSKLHKGKTISDKHKQQISLKAKGKIFSDEHNSKISEALTNKPKSAEHKQNLKLAWAQRKIITCPHCGKESQNTGMMNKWHFDNCSSIH